MGVFKQNVLVTNGNDLAVLRAGYISEADVRKMEVPFLIDSGAYMMAINETIQSQLELPLVEMRKVQVADGRVAEYPVAGPVKVLFANRKATCNAFVLPADSESLLGAIPMGEMDVMIHPQRQELMVNPEHPNYAVLKMK